MMPNLSTGSTSHANNPVSTEISEEIVPASSFGSTDNDSLLKNAYDNFWRGAHLEANKYSKQFILKTRDDLNSNLPPLSQPSTNVARSKQSSDLESGEQLVAIPSATDILIQGLKDIFGAPQLTSSNTDKKEEILSVLEKKVLSALEVYMLAFFFVSEGNISTYHSFVDNMQQVFNDFSMENNLIKRLFLFKGVFGSYQQDDSSDIYDLYDNKYYCDESQSELLRYFYKLIFAEKLLTRVVSEALKIDSYVWEIIEKVLAFRSADFGSKVFDDYRKKNRVL